MMAQVRSVAGQTGSLEDFRVPVNLLRWVLFLQMHRWVQYMPEVACVSADFPQRNLFSCTYIVETM